jgi:hypothetical protein
MSHGHGIATVLVIVISALLGVGAVPTPAMAATCYGASCNAQDPQVAGCSSGATTLEGMSDSGYYLELRYSKACNAAWVRVTSEGYWSQTGGFRLERYSPSSYFSGSFVAGEAGTKWTRMYNFEYSLRGRLEVTNYSSGYHAVWYTGWH